jgi:DNA-binding transcriptional regulator YiaG
MNEKLKALRREYHFSQADLARELDISIDSVRKWEQGYPFKPTERTMRKIQSFIDKLEHKPVVMPVKEEKK